MSRDGLAGAGLQAGRCVGMLGVDDRKKKGGHFKQEKTKKGPK